MTEIYEKIAGIKAEGGTAALCVIVSASGSTPRGPGSKMLVYPDRSFEGTIGGGELEQRVIEAAVQSIQDSKPQMVSYQMSDPDRGDPGVCGGHLEVYVEPILPQPTVIVIGAGHVGREVAELAKWLSFRVVISDDREESLEGELLESFDLVHHGTISELTKQVRLHPQTYIVLTTRNVEVDVAGLPDILASEAGYIGVIGSRRRWATTVKELQVQGVSSEQLEVIYSPVGLELEAETPKEIAVSIMAQIIMVRNGGHGRSMA